MEYLAFWLRAVFFEIVDENFYNRCHSHINQCPAINVEYVMTINFVKELYGEKMSKSFSCQHQFINRGQQFQISIVVKN